MKLQSHALLCGIKPNKGEIEGRPYDSTTFHISVDLASDSTEHIGVVTRPFKLGTSEEYKKWQHLKPSWPVGGLPVICEFDVIAGSDNSTKLTLLAIKPAPTPKAAA